MKLIHALAQWPQHARHIEAVWKHLPADRRGQFIVGPHASGVQLPRGAIIMVGSGPQTLTCQGRDQQLVYVEHGAGQAYDGDPKSWNSIGYHGNDRHPRNVRWYLCPRKDVADSWTIPHTGQAGPQTFVAGCPAIDDYVDVDMNRTITTVAITFHWDAHRLCPESGSALHHYLPEMAAIVGHLRGQGLDVVGHWHPRTPTMRTLWRDLGVDSYPDVDGVLRNAQCLIADNTSVMYEMAALGRPVLALNAPWYRRDVEHGLRFWSHIPGWQVDSPAGLLDLDVAGYIHEDWSSYKRESAVRYCYGRKPGGAGAAAAAWLVEQLETNV